MKPLFTFFVLLAFSFTQAQAQPLPSQANTKPNTSEAEKKDLTFAKRKSAFEDKNTKGKKEAPKEEFVDQTKIYDKPDNQIEYAEGKTAFVELVSKNLNIAVPINNEASAGKYKVELELIIDKDGKTMSIRPLTKLGFGMEDEAMRVLKMANNKWKAATVKGKNVHSRKVMIFTFNISEKEE